MLTLKTIKRFCKSYAVPLTVTGIFLIILVGLLVHRHIQLASLPDELRQGSQPEKSETRLISQDEAAKIKTKSNNELPPDTTASGSSSGQGSSPSSSQTSNGNDQNNNDGNSGARFSAEILGIDHTITDTSYNAEDQTCTIIHKIDAGVHTSNGPGKVIYHWRRSNSQRTPNETLRAARGDNNYLISHRWKITSRVGGPPEDKWVRFLMHQPDSGSRQQAFEHTCRPNI